MLDIEIDQSSVDRVIDYMEQIKLRIFAGVRQGMMEAMTGLAEQTVEEMATAGIANRSGELEAAILRSPGVVENDTAIRGRVSTQVGRKQVGIWLDAGIIEPAVTGHTYQFAEPDGNTFYTRGHRAFDVKPRPFIRESLRAYESTIFSIIQAKVDEAVAK